GSGVSRRLTGLRAGTEYVVQVAAANAQGQSPWSRSVKARTTDTAPSAPRIARVARGDASLSVAWLAPSSAGSVGVSGYVVETRGYSNGRWSAWSTLRVAPEVRSAKVTRLRNGMRTEVRVTATSRAGNSPVSASRVVVPAGKPLAPT